MHCSLNKHGRIKSKETFVSSESLLLRTRNSFAKKEDFNFLNTKATTFEECVK
jgi:hypothetical protein